MALKYSEDRTACFKFQVNTSSQHCAKITFYVCAEWEPYQTFLGMFEAGWFDGV
jgi:hypothetical protein